MVSFLWFLVVQMRYFGIVCGSGVPTLLLKVLLKYFWCSDVRVWGCKSGERRVETWGGCGGWTRILARLNLIINDDDGIESCQRTVNKLPVILG
jgi:hypothetical protein